MAPTMQSPMMSSTMTSIHDDDSSRLDMKYLSGMTMTDHIKEPQMHLVNPTLSASKLSSKRCSTASVSTTKSQLRHTNHLLIGMLQNIQSELETQRTIMLDIQHRVTHLEDESDKSVYSQEQQPVPQAVESRALGRHSSLLPPLPPSEGLSWWQACQNFARNSEPPISATEFLRTPQPYSAIDWPLGPDPIVEQVTQPSSPPHVEDLPPLTPTSDSEDSDITTPVRHDLNLGREIHSSSSRRSGRDDEDDIKGIEVEFDKTKLPTPPLLQPAPTGRPATIGSETERTSTEFEPEVAPKLQENPMRFYKGVKSLSTYKALLKNKSTEKEHRVLIHFHKRSDLKHLEGAE